MEIDEGVLQWGLKAVMIRMPALELVAAFVQVDHCEERRNGQILGPDPYFDDLFCGAAKKRYVRCESILPPRSTPRPLGGARRLRLEP